jgi:hypothetical protein
MSLTFQEIVRRRSAEIRRVRLEILGGEVALRGFNGDRLDYWQLFNAAHREEGRLKLTTPHYRATAIALALCDEEGRWLCDPYAGQLFADQVAALGDLEGKILDRLFDEVLALSALDQTTEDNEKNSGPSQN